MAPGADSLRILSSRAPEIIDGKSQRLSGVALRALTPDERIAALVDAGSMSPVDATLARPRPSPHLARWGIAARADDGIAVARGAIEGRPLLIAAQDETFVGGSVGERHGQALAALFARACAERPAAVVLLLASGGVRLHEANAAELALARALAALFDARAAGVPVLALAVGDVFGGASVLACAADRLAMLPRTRLGLSGPRVIELAHGKAELDADDGGAVSALFGAEARSAAGQVELMVDDAGVARAWIAVGARDDGSFASRVMAAQTRLAARLEASHQLSANPAPGGDRQPRWFADADAVDAPGWLWRMRGRTVWMTRPCSARPFGPLEAHQLDAALLMHCANGDPAPPRTLLIIEDSAGHEATRKAEASCVAQYFAQHAAVLALLRHRGVSLRGLLAGTGHSAAFFANALQAPVLFALEGSRVIAMDPAAIARVTGVDRTRLAALIEDDALLGQPVRCLARVGGVTRIVREIDPSTLAELAVEPV